jgi:hypothetical protein
MQRNTKNTNVVAIILLGLVTTLTFLLASCVPDVPTDDFINSIATVIGETSESSAVSAEPEISTAPGYTEIPIVKDIKNVTADVVVIAGTCEKDASVTISGGKEDVTVQSRNGYFIAQITLTNTTTTLLEATATIEGKECSTVNSFTASYVATAEKRLDGKGVSVGSGSQLYFDTYFDDYTGNNLFTQTELNDFKNNVNNKVTGLESKAGAQDVKFIYVLVPDVTTIYPDIFPADVTKTTFKTRYTQIADTLSATNTTFINIYDILTEAKNAGNYDIYRKDDSHLTEYGSYLVYQQIANAMAVDFPAAAARSLDEFTQETVDTIGGDFISYLGLTEKNYIESLVDLTPTFDINIGADTADKSSVNISDIRKYVSDSANSKSSKISTDNDYSLYNATDEDVVGITERFIVRTDRTELPCALIYRDDSTFPMNDILAERFNIAMFAKSGDFDINYTDAARYKVTDKKVVDYVIVIVSESDVKEMMDDIVVQ